MQNIERAHYQEAKATLEGLPAIKQEMVSEFLLAAKFQQDEEVACREHVDDLFYNVEAKCKHIMESFYEH